MNNRIISIVHVFGHILIIYLAVILSYILRFPDGFNLPLWVFFFVTIIYVSSYFVFGVYSLFRKLSDIVVNMTFSSFFVMITIGAVGFFDWTFRIHRTIIFMVVLFTWLFNILYTVILLKLSNPIKKTIVIDNLKEIKSIKKTNVGIVRINIPSLKPNQLYNIIFDLSKYNILLQVPSKFREFILTDDLDYKKDFIEIKMKPLSLVDRLIKRVLDLFLSFIGILIALIPMIMIAIMIKLDSRGSMIYKQRRMWEYGKSFLLYKFRTMVERAEKETGPVISDNKKDRRITKLGKFLRDYHLDELPQLFNVLLGHMSIVGPRPERPELSDKFNEQLSNWHKRLFVKPGMAGLAQLYNITGLEPEKKLRYDIYYIEHYSFLLDIKIIMKTIARLVLGEFR